jgi:hypothetical protein
MRAGTDPISETLSLFFSEHRTMGKAQKPIDPFGIQRRQSPTESTLLLRIGRLAGRQRGRSLSPDKVKNIHLSIWSRPVLGPTQHPTQ